MAEYKIGEKITIQIVETKEKLCDGCFFYAGEQGGIGCALCENILPCDEMNRTDGKSVIFKII